jgi:hypothetical protein
VSVPRPEQCAVCGGRVFVDAIDNHGQPYRGCARCRIVPLVRIVEQLAKAGAA